MKCVYEIDVCLPTGQRVPIQVESDLAPRDVTDWLSDLTEFAVVSFLVVPR